MHVVTEVCLDDVDGVVLSESVGADRVELCAGLVEGGTTPSIGTVAAVLARVSRIGVQVMIRPRGGGFAYSPAEVDVMLADIAAVRALPVPPGVAVGFVLGALTPDGALDEPVLARLVEACGGAPVTMHKAFDTLADLPDALERLVGLGFTRVLTSGGARTCAEGAPMLAALVEQAAGRIGVLAGGGVRAHNVAELVRRTGVQEVHFRASVPVAPAASASGVSYETGPRLVTAAGPVRDVLAALERDGG
ncbi:copper homeostasis protein CutC [Motilibacter deserti]|uniref:PF03932 family protein CutC n=1 Tax=Motilibacter deserti TaxID=2714956 RepID=A0ABX0GV51_9ACTN|nr:copper homeostasis protein CutC [Motilibacter deserti]